MSRFILISLLLCLPALALAETPVVKLGADGPNPQWISLDVPPTTVRGKELKMSACDKSHVPHWFTAEPVLHIDFEEGAPRMRIRRGNAGNYALRKPNGRISCTKKGKDINVKPVPGRWSLYLYSVKEQKPARQVSLAVVGLDRDTAFPGVAVTAVGAETAAPVELSGTVLGGQQVRARHKKCAGLAMSPRPDAVVDLAGGLKKVRFDLGFEDPAARLVVTRIGGPAKKLDLDCGRKTKRVFRLSTRDAERWGVWVAAPPAAAGKPWTVTVSHAGMKGGKLISTTEKRADMPLADRVLSKHYPNLQLEPNRLPTDPVRAHRLFAQLWETVDTRLVVYAADGKDYRKDEVLLPLSGGKTRIHVVNLEGVRRTVPTDRLAGQTKTPFIPSEPRATLPWQVLVDGPTLKAWTLEKDHGAIDTFFARVAKFDACFEREFRAVDSTGKAYDYNLVTYEDGEVVKVENWGSKVAKKAARKCGAAKVEKARDAFEARMKASFRAWRTESLAQQAAALKARLGAR